MDSREPRESMRQVTRRNLLITGAALVASAPAALVSSVAAAVQPQSPDPRKSGSDRSDEAYRIRLTAAAFQREQPFGEYRANGDEEELSPYIGAYSKGLPHNALGEVQPQAYALLLRALRSGHPRDFDFIPRIGEAKLTNPQGGLAFNLVGPDAAALTCPPAPRFASARQAAEMVELYWQALARDVPFESYESHPVIARAAAEIRRLERADSGRPSNLPPAAIFRGGGAGSVAGPYVSQFMLKKVFFAPLSVGQKFRSALTGCDHVDQYDSWLDLQNGGRPNELKLDTVPCYVRNGRDLAEYVHRDFTYQAALSAALILLDASVPMNPSNPYAGSRGQNAFVSFGAPYLLYLIATATQAALTVCWYQKWMVHRRLRPEELGGRIATQLRGQASYPFHPSLLDSVALAETLRLRSSVLLSSSYPEGSPTHPAYPAGHAVVSAAGITVLKAVFDESFVMPEPMVASADGLSLRRYEGTRLTVGGELDKLATNIGMGRCFAGIHWRSDVEAGLRLGEEIAILVLRELHLAAHEPFTGLRFHRLDGTPVAA